MNSMNEVEAKGLAIPDFERIISNLIEQVQSYEDVAYMTSDSVSKLKFLPVPPIGKREDLQDPVGIVEKLNFLIDRLRVLNSKSRDTLQILHEVIG